MAATLSMISSMATRQILAELSVAYQRQTGRTVDLQSVGGVEAARRMRAGEAFDIVALAADALQALASEGIVRAETVRALVRSPTAVAVPAGARRPPTCDEATIRGLVSQAKCICLSTGPSGKTVAQLLASWGIADVPERRIMVAPPGVPVARVLAAREADVGFQQYSEMMEEPGIEIVGKVPQALQPLTVFSIGISRSAAHVADGETLIAYLTSPATNEVKQRYGMEPGTA